MKAEVLHKRDFDNEEDALNIGIVKSTPTRGESKRLAVYVDFYGEVGWIFIERPRVDVDWIERLLETLKKTEFSLYGIEEIRFGCKGEIEIKEEEDQIKVIDKKKDRIFHTKPGGNRRVTSDSKKIVVESSYITNINS